MRQGVHGAGRFGGRRGRRSPRVSRVRAAAATATAAAAATVIADRRGRVDGRRRVLRRSFVDRRFGGGMHQPELVHRLGRRRQGRVNDVQTCVCVCVCVG